jgi:hypothetical protein
MLQQVHTLKSDCLNTQTKYSESVMQSPTAVSPKVKRKTFTYHTLLSWVGGRAGTLRSDGEPESRVASPSEFKDEAGIRTPEGLFVAAVDICSIPVHQQTPLLFHPHTGEIPSLVKRKNSSQCTWKSIPMIAVGRNSPKG